MKYVEPKYEKLEILTNEIMSASGEIQESITDGDLTISGKKDEFSLNFKDLFGF